jgi:hypothetical protein
MFQFEHERLKREAEELRSKVKKLEEENEGLEAKQQAGDNIKGIIEQLKGFAPLLIHFVGKNTRAGQVLDGFGSNGADANPEEDGAVTGFMGIIREFITELDEAKRQQLLSVMILIRQDHRWIGRIANCPYPTTTEATN